MIQVKNLTLQYKEYPILRDLNFTLEAGKVYSIIGPNGCGKTTLLRSITGNLRPAKGSIHIMGKDLRQYSPKGLAQFLAVLHQTRVNQPELTVRQLVGYGRNAHKTWWRGTTQEDIDIVEQAIARTRMETLAERRLGQLSGGERQRAWLAMCLAQSPKLLVLDEPTTYLDISHQLEIMELISSLNREEGLTILMVLHDINHAARYSHELLVLHQGTQYALGKPWELLHGNMLEEVFHVEAKLYQDDQGANPLFFPTRVIGGQA